MEHFLNGPGFLGTGASFHSDASLVLILLTAVLFTIGVRLAILKKYEAHRWVQTSSATLNALVVLSVMVTSFVHYILPGIPEKLSQGDYAVTTFHAIIGTIGLLFGVFVVLRANKLVPVGLRFKNYKLFMRTSYALYMLATFMGVIVYCVVFILGI